MKKVVIKMRGGLGNQLFILSYLLCLINKYKPNISYKIDLSEYKNYKTRNFELYEYVQNSSIINPDSLTYQNKNISDIFYKIFRILDYLNRKTNYIISEKNFLSFTNIFGVQFFRHGMGEIKKLKYKNTLLTGYFQDVKYVDPCLEEMKKLTMNGQLLKKLKNNEKFDEYLFKIKSSKNNIAISMRLGKDYKNLDYPIYEGDYFYSGINFIAKKLKWKKINIFVFSDDIEESKRIVEKFDNENSKFNYIFIKNMNPIESLFLMNNCSHYVIANSSFSWWGQKLSMNTNDKEVIAPLYWLDKKRKLNELGIYEENFTLVNQNGTIVLSDSIV